MGMELANIAVYLPEKTIKTASLADFFPDWSFERHFKKFGIQERHIADVNEYVSDLAFKAAEKLFDAGINRDSIDYIIVCTQTADHSLPATACLLQDKLGLKRSIGAIDINQGCSGYVYGLSLAYGLIETQQAKNILLITSDTYSKLIDESDLVLGAIFGDAATATLLTGTVAQENKACFLFGTDGSGYNNLIAKHSGMKGIEILNERPYLYMNGTEIMKFVLQNVPEIYDSLLKKAHISSDQIRYFVFHQANLQMLNLLKDILNIPPEKFTIELALTGNTVSSTIPIVLDKLTKEGKLASKDTIMLVGFGVGYSWSACILNQVI